jgi:hypothetical protein
MRKNQDKSEKKERHQKAKANAECKCDDCKPDFSVSKLANKITKNRRDFQPCHAKGQAKDALWKSRLG